MHHALPASMLSVPVPSGLEGGLRGLAALEVYHPTCGITRPLLAELSKIKKKKEESQ